MYRIGKIVHEPEGNYRKVEVSPEIAYAETEFGSQAELLFFHNLYHIPRRRG